MSDAVLPRGRVHPVERELAHDVLVDAAQGETLLRTFRYGHHDERVVTVIGFFVLVVRCRGRGVFFLVLGGAVVVIATAANADVTADATGVRVVLLQQTDVVGGYTVFAYCRRLVLIIVCDWRLIATTMTALATEMVFSVNRRCGRRRRAAVRPRAVVDRQVQTFVDAAAVAGHAAGGVRLRSGRSRAVDVRVPFVVHVQMAENVIDRETRPVQRFGDHFHEFMRRSKDEM